jgi:hypothetical protein
VVTVSKPSSFWENAHPSSWTDCPTAEHRTLLLAIAQRAGYPLSSFEVGMVCNMSHSWAFGDTKNYIVDGDKFTADSAETELC